MKNNRKGFTLVELLAVIVILAILMVSAGAAVMSTLNNARVNTFKNEALSALDVADNMYTEISMDASDSNTYLFNDSTRAYKAMCVTLQGLVTNGYLDKDVGKDGSGAVKGVILIEVPFDGGATKKSIWMTNSTHGITGYEESKISSLKFKNENNSALKTGSPEAYINYWENPTSQGVVTDLTVIESVVDPANGAADSLPGSTSVEYQKSDGSFTALTNSLIGSDSTKEVHPFTKDTPNIRFATFHSPVTELGGTGLTYSGIICINGPIA